MPLARRLVSLAIGSLLCAVSVSGQSTTDVTEAIPNWTAPPFWTPPALAALERAKSEGALPLGSEAIEGLPTAPLPFFGIRPCRVVDTRPAFGFTGAYGPPILAAGAVRDFDLNSAPHCPGIPANAEAYSINVTITETTGPGDIRIWPAGNPPTVPVSTQNWPSAGYTLANAAIVPAGTGGSVTVQVAASNTHLLIDINGYYAPIPIVNTVNTLSGALTLVAGSNVSITPSGQTLTIANTAPPAWSLNGNGISPGQFLGTTNDVALELKAFNQRVMRFEPTAAPNLPNVIGGSSANSVAVGVRAATISGGGADTLPGTIPNTVSANHGTVGGGGGNRVTVNAGYGTVAGGQNNIASGFNSTVAGGVGNESSGNAAAVCGGTNNDATGNRSVVGGGELNSASGHQATVPGGSENLASGDYSFAAGRNAKADDVGAFVWADSTIADLNSTAANQFLVRANGGAVFIRSAPSVPTVAAALTAQNGTSGEAAWFYTSSPSVPWPVVKLLKNESATNNFLECVASGVSETTKCHITPAGSFVAGSDFAEALPAKGGKWGYEPGDVLIASKDRPGGVEKSSRRYDTRAIGVYSTRPGFIGADKDGNTRIDADDIPVAITGIVPTKVTAENGWIEPGDLLTTSSTPGHAMKATPVAVAGVEIYPSGAILGKALEPLTNEEGVIRVLVQGR